MKNPEQELCGCCGIGKPVHELRHLIEMLDRQEAEKKAREERAKKK
jgi:hypothetical protein